MAALPTSGSTYFNCTSNTWKKLGWLSLTLNPFIFSNSTNDRPDICKGPLQKPHWSRGNYTWQHCHEQADSAPRFPISSNFTKELCAITHALEHCAGEISAFFQADLSSVSVESGCRGTTSVRHHLFFAATRAAIDCYKFSLFDIELLGLVHYPFMMTVTTQGIALVLFLQCWFTKGNDVRHECSSRSLEKGAL